MSTFSTLRSRRMANKKARAVRQMIGFRLDREWFALPILAIHRVVPLGKIYGDPKNTGISLTTYEERELLIIDVAKQIFNNVESSERDRETTDLAIENILNIEQQRYLLVLENEGKEPTPPIIGGACALRNLLGLPIDSPPTMHRVESNAFKPLPEAYLKQGNINCISSQIIELPDLPPLFILDRQKLIATTQQRT